MKINLHIAPRIMFKNISYQSFQTVDFHQVNNAHVLL